MTDYATLIDAETWAFIERTNSFYPPDTAQYGIAEQRAIYDALCRAFHAGYPEGVTVRDRELAMPGRSIKIRRYEPAERAGPKALIVYFHGGGFVVGGLESHDDVCAELCARTGHSVVSVDYRLAPEHVHPAQSRDAIDAFRRLAGENPGQVILCGDSAGGTLCAGVSHAVRGEVHVPAGQVLIYPALGNDQTTRSYREHAEAPMLTLADIKAYETMRTGGRAISHDPTYLPLMDSDFSRLPPTVMVSAECDPLSDDCGAYRDALREAGGKAHWIEEKGLVHGYLRARHSVRRANESFTRIIDAVSALARGDWPY